jgi:hypothetical protein
VSDRPVQACPEIPLAELADAGYVQEANRRFFHPLGLALAYEPSTGRLMVLDARDDAEGVNFATTDLAPKAALIDAEWEKRAPVRFRGLGYIVQPVVWPETPQPWGAGAP